MKPRQIPKEVQETARQMGADTIVYFDDKGHVTIQTENGQTFIFCRKRPKNKHSRGPAKAVW